MISGMGAAISQMRGRRERQAAHPALQRYSRPLGRGAAVLWRGGAAQQGLGQSAPRRADAMASARQRGERAILRAGPEWWPWRPLLRATVNRRPSYGERLERVSQRRMSSIVF